MLDRVRLSNTEVSADQSAVEIGVLYREARAGIVTSVRCCIEAGQLLAAKKAELPHGQWLPWLANNADELGFDTPRTAQRLMDVAAKYPNTTSNVAFEAAEALQINREIWGNGGTRGLATGVAMDAYAERGNDLYETPPGAVRALLEVEKFEGPIWEPGQRDTA
jgi:Protein of unknown function (DUF3102)